MDINDTEKYFNWDLKPWFQGLYGYTELNILYNMSCKKCGKWHLDALISISLDPFLSFTCSCCS